MRIALCDDNAIQLEAAATALSAFVEERGIKASIGTFNSIVDLLACEELASFDVAFMDIEFDGKPLGIDAVRRVNETAPNCQVVYLTNYIQYSVDVYQTEHAWFVVKSQFERRLPEIFEKLARIEEARRAFIVIKLKDGTVCNVDCQDVLYFERRKRITHAVTTAATYETPEKLADIMRKLPPTSFVHCHNSYIVNLPHVAKIHASDLVLDDGQVVPVSRRYAKTFRERYFDWAEQWTV